MSTLEARKEALRPDPQKMKHSELVRYALSCLTELRAKGWEYYPGVWYDRDSKKCCLAGAIMVKHDLCLVDELPYPFAPFRYLSNVAFGWKGPLPGVSHGLADYATVVSKLPSYADELEAQGF